MEAFLNAINDLERGTVETLYNEHLTVTHQEKYNQEKFRQVVETWHQGAPFEIETVLVDNEEVTLGLVNTEGKSRTFILSLSRASKPLIDAIKLKA